MNRASNQWGIEINGAAIDKRIWQEFLKPPFDPFTEEITERQESYLVLRSSRFDDLSAINDVHCTAKQLLHTLNAVMAKNADSDPVSQGAVIEFIKEGQPLKHRRIEAEAGTIRLRGGIVEITVRDADGNVMESPPAPSRAQLWMRAANLNPDIGSALQYIEGKPGWVELYKAYDALKLLPQGDISKKEIKRFTQTANSNGERHHPSPTRLPHKRPMELWEARAFITQWISAAINDVLAKNPQAAP